MKLKPSPWSLLAAMLVVVLLGCNRTQVRTDAQVAAEVQGTIARDPKIVTRNIAVTVEHGTATLLGTVSGDDERALAARDAASVDGVKTVVNNLTTREATEAPEQSPAGPRTPQSAKKSASMQTRMNDEAVGSLPKAPPSESVASANAPPDTAPAPPPPAAPPKKVTIPAGTQLNVRLNDGLDTEKNQLGDTFHATLGAPIVVSDETVIPSGADITGRVVDVKSAGRFAGNSVLTLELNSLSVNGRQYNIQTNQWTRQGKGEGKNTAVKAGGGAAIGAIIGGLAGGGKGAGIGSVAGAGAGTGAAATKKGEQIKLAPEASLSFLLTNALTVTPQSSNNRNSGRESLQ